MKWEKLWMTFLVLLLPVFPLFSAEKQLAPGHVPSAVARGKIAPLGRVPGTNQLHLALGLSWRNQDALTNLLAAICNPASPEFHHYLTPAQFTARFGPTPADYQAVLQFARSNGLAVTATHRNRMLVDVQGAAADVERAFHVRLKNYRHPTEPRNFFAPDTEPTVDARLPVQSVSGLNDFSRPHPNVQLRPVGASKPLDGSGPGGLYLGPDLLNAYLPGCPLQGTGQSVGLLEMEGYYESDITNYEALINLTNNVPQLVNVPVDGGPAFADIGGIAEASLDIEMVLAMAPGVSNIYVYESPEASAGWVDLLSRMAEDNLASSLSCSWFADIADPTAEQVFQQMAAQGQTFFAASGDSDAYPGAIPFPCDNPNVTLAGGTSLTTTNGDYAAETAWNRGDGHGSGGGVSMGHGIPGWQAGLATGSNGVSATMRNVPDVALTADNIFIFYDDGFYGDAAGTSCAAPMWAGIIALANQQAAQLGQPPVGFINPALYAIARGTNYSTAFHDIVTGDNTSAASPANFFAAAGYDLCTGLGTPNGTNLINALTAPDGLGIVPATVFAINGPVGGPFTATNFSFTLTNTGAASLDWSLGDVPLWLAAAPTNGTLVAGATATVNLDLQNVVFAFPAGNYLTSLEITNETLSRVQAVTVSLVVGGSIVQNGGFETGDFTGWTLAGDTLAGNLIYNAVASSGDFAGVVHSGNYGAFLGEGGFPATLSQTVATMPGQLYQFSFWLDNPQAGTNQIFAASWDGNSLVNFTNPPAFAWTNFQFLVPASDTNTVLQFAAENDPNYFGFDDVSVAPVPAVAFGTLTQTNSNLLLAWNALAGLNYQIQYTTDLTQTNWQVLGTVTAATNFATFLETNLSGPDPQRFYRLVLSP